MSKKQRKPRHVHVDRFAVESARHQTDVSRDQERWKGERIDLQLPEKRARGDHKKRHTNDLPKTPPVAGE